MDADDDTTDALRAASTERLRFVRPLREESEQRIRVALDTFPALSWCGAPNGSIEMVNQRWLVHTGLSEQDALGHGWRSAIHPDDLPGLDDYWAERLSSGTAGDHEARLRRFDGEYRWCLFRNEPVRDGSGEIARWYGTHTDVDERVRAVALLAGEKRLLEMVAKGESLPMVLDALCKLVEDQYLDATASILLVDEAVGCLRHGAGPNLPKGYTDAIDGSPVGPSAGSCGTAVYRGEPVIAADIANDPLWAQYRELALEYGMRACWSTPILARDRTVIGTFATYYKKPRSPTPYERTVIDQITHLASIAIERVRAEVALRRQAERLQTSLEDKEALLKEVHHRVKNNLQLINSLLSLQAERSLDPAVSELLADSRNRVRSMALVHENLYRAGNFARIAMAQHIQNLCAHLGRAYGVGGDRIKLELKVSDLNLEMERAVSCGLIINELVSNALKHAFPDGRAGTVWVELAPLDALHHRLTVRDDGVGLTSTLPIERYDSLGLQLVHDLTDQLHGTIELSRASGTLVSVVFEASARAGHRA